MLPGKRNLLRFFGGVDPNGLARQHDGRVSSWPKPPPTRDPIGYVNPSGPGRRIPGEPDPTELPFLRRELYVWAESGRPVGPVSVDQIARGILAGKVPLHAYVTRPGDPAWTKVLEMRDVVRALEISSQVETVEPSEGERDGEARMTGSFEVQLDDVRDEDGTRDDLRRRNPTHEAIDEEDTAPESLDEDDLVDDTPEEGLAHPISEGLGEEVGAPFPDDLGSAIERSAAVHESQKSLDVPPSRFTLPSIDAEEDKEEQAEDEDESSVAGTGRYDASDGKTNPRYRDADVATNPRREPLRSHADDEDDPRCRERSVPPTSHVDDDEAGTGRFKLKDLADLDAMDEKTGKYDPLARESARRLLTAGVQARTPAFVHGTSPRPVAPSDPGPVETLREAAPTARELPSIPPESEEEPPPPSEPPVIGDEKPYASSEAPRPERDPSSPNFDEAPPPSARSKAESGVLAALATALSLAAEQGRWDVVLELARQLEARKPSPKAPDSTIFFLEDGAIKPTM